jgi:hypothetical protein
MKNNLRSWGTPQFAEIRWKTQAGFLFLLRTICVITNARVGMMFGEVPGKKPVQNLIQIFHGRDLSTVNPRQQRGPTTGQIPEVLRFLSEPIWRMSSKRHFLGLLILFSHECADQLLESDEPELASARDMMIRSFSHGWPFARWSERSFCKDSSSCSRVGFVDILTRVNSAVPQPEHTPEISQSR